MANCDLFPHDLSHNYYLPLYCNGHWPVFTYSSFKLINSHLPPNLNWFLAHLRPCRFNATNWCLSGRISLVHTGWWICRWGWSIWYHKSQIRTSNAYLASIALPTDRHSPSPSPLPLSLTFFCCCLPISFSTMRARQIETRIVVWIIQCTSEGISPRHSLTSPGSLLLLPTTLQLLTVSNFFLYHRIRTQIDFTLACLPACLLAFQSFWRLPLPLLVVCEPARNFNEPASMWAN